MEVEMKAKELMDKLKIYLDSKDIDPQKSLYHYTTFKGLTGILESRQLWLTDHAYLNDPSEMQHGKNLILRYIEKNISINPQLKNWLKHLTDEIVVKGYKAFITAFCCEADYLPAWRYYGDDGAGFSIGFRKEYFLRNQNGLTRDSAALYKVEYQNNHFSQIDDIFQIANKIYPNWFTKDREHLKPYISSLITNLVCILPCAKNEDYKDEHEWRLCMLRIYYNNVWTPELPMERLIIDKIPNSIAPPFLKNIKTAIPRIKSLEFEYSDIETIIIGPRLDYLTAKLAIEKILLDKGITIPELNKILIIESKRPYQ